MMTNTTKYLVKSEMLVAGVLAWAMLLGGWISANISLRSVSEKLPP